LKTKNKTKKSGGSIKDYSVTCMIIDKSSFKLTNNLLKRLINEARIAKKPPLLVLEFKGESEIIILEGKILKRKI
jgi:hypothetical protein